MTHRPVSTATQAARAVAEAAERLQRAACTGLPCPPVRGLIGAADIVRAYAVQQLLTASRLASGARVVGRKIGLTSPAVQRQLGVAQPDFGVLFDDMRVGEDDAVPMSRLSQPKVEAEVAFVLGADLDGDDLDAERVGAAVEYAVAALEIVDSRIQDWDITIADTVADNASSGLFVLGATRRAPSEFTPADVSMRLVRDDRTVSTGNGRACLGDPLSALAWLARTVREYGSPLRAGEIVLSGALGPMVSVSAGDRFAAEISPLGRVSVTFSGREA